jgi:hypothetical protein
MLELILSGTIVLLFMSYQIHGCITSRTNRVLPNNNNNNDINDDKTCSIISDDDLSINII